MAVQQQTIIIAALALLLVYYLAIPRSGSWTKRPHDLHAYDPLADDEPLLVAVLRFPFRILRLPLTISAWFFEVCCNLAVYSACSNVYVARSQPAVGIAMTRAAGLTLVLLGFLFSLTVVGLCIGVPLIFIGSFMLFLATW